jgi:hypothetical protein
MCRRTILKTDEWRVNDAGYKVHRPGFCRGPRAKHWYMVGSTASGEERHVGRLPDTVAEIKAFADQMIGQGMQIELRRLDLKRLQALIERMCP